MDKFVKILASGFTAVLLLAFPAFAGDKAEAEPKWYDKLTINGGITTVFQGSSGNTDATDAKSGDNLDFANSVDIGVESDLAEGHKMVIALEAGQGGGLTGRVGGSTFRPNYDAYPTSYANVDGGANQQGVTVSQAYYEGMFLNNALMLSVGRMDCHSMFDENAFAGDETAQFMGGPFVRLAGALYPELGVFGQYYASGVSAHIHTSELYDLHLMAANAEPSKMGTGAHFTVQLNLMPKPMGREGNYRVYYFQDHRKYQPITGGGAAKSNYGVGVSLDQYVTDDVGLFFRYGQQDASVQLLDSAGAVAGTDPLASVIVLGAHFEGALWGKEKDHIGIGYATGKMKSDLSAANPFTGDESMVEAYYHCQVFDGFSLSPDVQLHSNLPRASARNYTAFALRMQIDF